jgi:lantibiotic modifying enzyme
LIEEACRVGTRLQELALQEEQHATWIGFAYVNKIWSLDPLFEDLYGGSSGIILALAYLGSFGFSEFTELARCAQNTLRTRLENKNEHIRSIGAFDGWSGIIYMLSHLAALWQDAELLSYAGRLLDRLPGLLDQDKSLDIIGGCAGCIGALLAFERIAGSNKALTVAVQCAERLVAQAQPMEHGAGWFNNIDTVRPITGFGMELPASPGPCWNCPRAPAIRNIKMRLSMPSNTNIPGTPLRRGIGLTPPPTKRKTKLALPSHGAMALPALAWPGWRP